MKIFGKEYEDLPGLNLDIDASKGEEFELRLQNSRKQLEDLLNSNYDLNIVIKNIISNEIYNNIARIISKELFSKKIEHTIEDLHAFLDNNKLGKYIITSSSIGYYITEYEKFNPIPNDILIPKSNINLIGYIGETKIYVDPYMMWIDRKMAIFSDDFFNFKEGSIDAKSIQTDLSARISYIFKIKMEDVNSKVFLIK